MVSEEVRPLSNRIHNYDELLMHGNQIANAVHGCYLKNLYWTIIMRAAAQMLHDEYPRLEIDPELEPRKEVKRVLWQIEDEIIVFREVIEKEHSVWEERKG